MAKKAVNKTKGQEVVFIPAKGTGQARYGYGVVSASLATLNRLPVALPAKAKAQSDPKGPFLLSLLEQAGKNGLTWQAMQAALKERFGVAPKKRHSLYAVLQGRVWHKTTGQKGVVTYFLGREPKKRSRNQA